MFLHSSCRLACFAGLLGAATSPALSQITISGVTDKTVYANTVSFTVATQAGYSYGVFLNAQPVQAGIAITVNRPDFYDLYAWRTNQSAPFDVASTRVRFIVRDTTRGDTEWGLPPQTPMPVIQSSSNEFAGAQLRLIMPQDFPTGYEIPVVAWAVNDEGHAVRANGLLSADGHPSIQMKRGVGSGFLVATHPAGPLDYTPHLQGVLTNKVVNLESSTTWTPVSGVLGAATVWPENSRIRVTTNLALDAGSTLTIGAGTIVLLNPRVNITNNGAIVINGTVERPVVFMPISRAQPWGGFFMRTASGSIEGTGVIFTGSGADPSGGAGHRSEQCLFLVDSTPRITLTDSAAIYLAGQLGHSYNGGTYTYTRFLMQRCTTGGEYTGAQFTVNDSAFIECPDDSSNFVDGDNDALYLVDASPTRPHGFTNTLFGWTKDDGIDSGGGGYGPLRYQNCWFEATFHEGNSLSGYKDTRVWDTVYYDCGQGIENGYNGPTNRMDHCLFVACQVGARHGDNYPSIGNYDGRATVTNSILLYNHRDVFGYNWHSGTGSGWTQAVGQMFIDNNLLTTFDTNFPNNAAWNPVADAGRLRAFQTAPIDHVGVALATRAGQTALSNFPDGIPVALSTFCANEVTVEYATEATDGTSLTGTLHFAPGQVRNYIPAPPAFIGVLRVALRSPQHADLTGTSEVLFQNVPAVASSNVTLVASNSMWRYLDTGGDPGTAWRQLSYSDNTWSNGLAQLGFGDSDERTPIRRNGTNGTQTITYYFRQQFFVADPAPYTSLLLWLLRDDGGVVHLNEQDVWRSSNLPPAPAAIGYQTLADYAGAGTAENAVDSVNVSPTRLVAGANIVAVEIHQHDITSSDASFDFTLTGLIQPPPRLNWGKLGGDLALYWNDPAYILEQAPAITGPWSTASSTSPQVGTPLSTTFYRLRKL
jgi:hypothetical protein